MKNYPQIALNHLERLRSKFDGYLVGYPKVGNTWMQVMLRRAFVSHFGLDVDDMARVLGPRHRIPSGVPAIEVTHLMPYFNDESYEEMRLVLKPLAGRPVVVLIRNPADTLVSLYFHKAVRKKAAALRPPFVGTVDELVRSATYGIEKYLRFYLQIDEARRSFGAHEVIGYEEMVEDPAAALRRALEVYGVRASQEAIDDAVSFGSFDNMRRLESDDALGISALKPYASHNPEARKVRKGGVGGFRSHLEARTIELIEERTRDSLPADLRARFEWATA